MDDRYPRNSPPPDVEAGWTTASASSQGALGARAASRNGGRSDVCNAWDGATASPALDAPVGSPLPKVGTWLRDRFLLTSELGGGRHGVVFLARDDHTHQRVAIKVLRNEQALARFKREYRSLRDLAHPHVISALELFVDGAPAFLVMPYVEGRHLDLALRDAEPEASSALCRSYFAQLALALHALHRAGIVHRDVKPSNVLVSEDGFLYLIDLGLATSTNASAAGMYSTRRTSRRSSSRGPATPSSDWYSFGVMLYQALAGASVHRHGR